MSAPPRTLVPASAPPVHVVVSGPSGGIGLTARQIAGVCGARVLEAGLAELDAAAAVRPSDEAWHVHFSDRLYGATSAEAAARLARWAARGPLTVTFHDVPQAWADPARKRAYVDIAASATAWAVNSHHEVALLDEARRSLDLPALGPGHVVPLAVVEEPARRRPVSPVGDGLTLGVLGWVYPDKGHREVMRAAARLRASGPPVRVVCLGAPVVGHLDLVEELQRRADAADVELTVTGYLDDDELAEAMGTVDVPVAAHLHLSASASINSWLGTGRRPLVPLGRYAAELEALRPGTLLLYDADPDGHGLDAAVQAAVEDRTVTWLPEHTDLAPRLSDTVASYRAWWAVATYAGPHPTKPVLPEW